MPETKPAWEPLGNYQAFATYQTQEAAAAAGAPGARDYLSRDDEKAWFDLQAEEPGPGKYLYAYKGVPWVLYRHGAFSGQVDDNKDGIIVDLAMPLTEAGKVNIKPTGPGMTNVPGTGITVPVPLKTALAASQKLRQKDPFSGFQVRNLDVIIPAEQAAQDVKSTAAGVVRIETKVDKILTKMGIT